ncbi:MAG: GAF domain-containing protein [bacterium]|nr:GAF domain-containing protein [bacterium]MCP4798900.1 GAF domain-containing protein [bacterium]
MNAINSTSKVVIKYSPAFLLAQKASRNSEKPEDISINAVRLLVSELSCDVQIALKNINPRGMLLYSHKFGEPDSSTSCRFIPCDKMEFSSCLEEIGIENTTPMIFNDIYYGFVIAEPDVTVYAEKLALRIGHAFELLEMKLEYQSLLRRVDDSDSAMESMKTWFEHKISDLANAEQSLKQRLQYEKAITACSRTLFSEEQNDETVATALEYLRKASGTEHVLLMKNNYIDSGELAAQLIYTASEEPLSNIPQFNYNKQWLYSSFFPKWSKPLSENNIVTGTADKLQEPADEIVRAYGIKSYMVLPLFVLGQWYGFLAFGSKSVDKEWLNEDINILRTGAEMLANWCSRKQMAQNLRDGQETARVLLNTPIFAAFLLDSQGVVISNNEIAEKMFHAESSQLIGKELAQYIPRKLRSILQNSIADSRKYGITNTTDYEYKNRFYTITVCPVFDSKKKSVEKMALYVEDCTEKHELEIQLRQAQKLESAGRLADGFAHELNTPVQTLSNYINFLKPAFNNLIDGNDIEKLKIDIPETLDHARDRISEVTEIVSSMKEFSHPEATGMSAIDLNQAINSTATVARDEWKYIATVETDFDENLPPVVCLPDEISQVISNLVCNAAQAIEQTQSSELGSIGISTKLEEEFAVIRVVDTGTGIPADIQDSIFDPFFTTKEDGSGAGQGLSICHSLIYTHNGEISFETELGKGTTFIVKLPLKQD